MRSLIFLLSALFVVGTANALPKLTYKKQQLPTDEVVHRVESELQSSHDWEKDWHSSFYVFGNAHVEDAEIIVVPELHHDAFARLVQVLVVQKLASPGDAVYNALPANLEAFKKGCAHFADIQLTALNIHDQLSFRDKLLGSKSFSHLKSEHPLWPHAEKMTCNGWDSMELLQLSEHQRSELTDKNQQLADLRDKNRKNEARVMARREQIVKPFKIKLADIQMDNFKETADWTLFHISLMASDFARNREMIKVIKDREAQMSHAAASAGSHPSRIFIFAGAGHLVPACMSTCTRADLKRIQDTSITELAPFLAGRKFVVLAHKELFVNPLQKGHEEL
jgi:hypothetical protein